MAKAAAKPKKAVTRKRAIAANGYPRRANNSLTVPMVTAALRASGGLQTIAAGKLQCGKSTLCEFIKKHPEIKAVQQDISESMVDRTEAKLLGAIEKGEGWAIRFLLEHKGQSNGYGLKRVEITGKDGGPIQYRDVSTLSDDELAIIEQAALALAGGTAGDSQQS